MLSDLILALKDIQEKPICDYFSHGWVEFYDCSETVKRACPLTQIALKHGLVFDFHDITTGNDICNFLESEFELSATYSHPLYVAWMRYDQTHSLTAVINQLEGMNRGL